jgi:hypothetical protein
MAARPIKTRGLVSFLAATMSFPATLSGPARWIVGEQQERFGPGASPATGYWRQLVTCGTPMRFEINHEIEPLMKRNRA